MMNIVIGRQLEHALRSASHQKSGGPSDFDLLWLRGGLVQQIQPNRHGYQTESWGGLNSTWELSSPINRASKETSPKPLLPLL